MAKLEVSLLGFLIVIMAYAMIPFLTATQGEVTGILMSGMVIVVGLFIIIFGILRAD